MAAPPDPPVVAAVDLVLPVLDEALALPTVLAGLPAGVHPIVVDNGSTDGSGDVARAAGAEVVEEPRRGFGSACWAGLNAATADIVAFMDCDGSFDGADIPLVVGPVAGGRADLVLGARQPVDRRAWPTHARLANTALAGYLRRRTGAPLHDLGPLRAARRADLLALGLTDRGFGWPLEMVLRAQLGGWRLEEVPVRYAPRIGRSKVTGTVRGTYRAVRDMRRVLAAHPARGGDAVTGAATTALLVVAKAPVAGRSKTRLCPPLTPAQAAAVAEAALADTLDAVAACRAGRRVLVLDGEPGPWLPPGFEVVPQRGAGLDERLAAAHCDAGGGPTFQVGMDTPQLTAALLDAALDALHEPGVDAVLGPALDGGWWGIGLHAPRPEHFLGVPMSAAHTGAAQRRRLLEHGLRVDALPCLRDVDRWEDAVAVATDVPDTRFANLVRRLPS